jgi:proteasome lid subunit RPN8/RPN11
MLRLTHTSSEKIRQHGKQTYPEECCGVLLGMMTDDERRVEDVLAITNTHEDERTRRFLITADEYFHAMKEAQKRNLDIVGFYHSHPDHPARPSQYDLEHAAWSGFSYIIVSVQRGEPTDMASWTVDEGKTKFEEEEVRIEQPPH